MGWHVVVATLLPVSSLEETHRKTAQLGNSGLVAGLASPPSPMPEGKTEHHSLDRGTSCVCWAGLCGEWAAREGENLAGMVWEGESVSVGLHSCRLPSHPRNIAVLSTETAQPALSAASTY